MDWSKGYTVLHYAMLVDPVSWKDIARVEVQSGSIKKSTDSLLQAADIICGDTEDLYGQEKWLRIYADVRQEDDTYHGPLFTGLISTPSKNIEGSKVKSNLQCYSVLKPAEDILLDRGWYVPAKTEAATMVKNLLSVSPAPITIDGINGELLENLVAESGETNLSMAWRILDMMNWRLAIAGDGSITITSYPTIKNDAVLFDADVNDCLETTININHDWFNCPNVFRAIHNTAIAVAKDEKDDSPLSIQNRGREVWMEETDCTLKSNETLGDYAKRRLNEEQNIAYQISYNRRFHPDVDVEEIVRINYPAQGISGYFGVRSQTLTLGYGITVAEEATKRS